MGNKYLTVIAILRDESHVIHQTTDTLPGHTGVRIGAHIALRSRELGDDLESLVIIDGATVTEHLPARNVE